MKIYFSEMRTTWGSIYLAATSRGLAGVQMGGSKKKWLTSLRRRFPLAEGIEGGSAFLREAQRELREYLSGRRSAFRVKVDWAGLTNFQRSVLRAVNAIPYGKTRTYGEIAQRIKRPRAARAVGGAVGGNPYAPIVPCHRVLAANGMLGGYSGAGGVKTKKRLLELEQAELKIGGRG
jgi:O-6-methylguanine DNA methyltransferase